jgi:O-antigen ligase
MNAAALTTPDTQSVQAVFPGAVASRWPLIITAFVIGFTFFLSEHKFHVSLDEAYTQNAEEMEITAEGGNLVRRLAFPALAAWGLFLFLIGKQPLRIDPLLFGSIALILAWAAASILWSDDPGMCLRRLIVLACSMLGAAGIARWLSLHDLNLVLLLVLGGFALIGIFAEVSLGTFRPWAGDYRFSGTVHPNTQGPALAGVCLAAFALGRTYPSRRLLYGAIFALALILLILTKSRSSAAGFLLAFAAILIVQTSLRWKASVGLIALWAGSLALWLLLVAGIDPISDFRNALLLGRADESDTLSGRAFIWPEVAYYINQRPWTGFGYGCFWTVARIETISETLGWGVREAHNAYLDTILALGFIGLLLTLVMVGASGIATLRGYLTHRDSAYALPLGMLVFALFNATLESGIVDIEAISFFMACCLLRISLFNNGTPVPTTSRPHHSLKTEN